jgi:hypothetical protein
MSKINDSSSLGLKTFVFFILYAGFLLGSIVFSLRFSYAILIGFLIILFWKILLGMSWVNFSFLFICFFEANIINFFIKPLWVVLFVLLFLFFFWRRCFSNKIKNQGLESNGNKLIFIASSKKEKHWRDIIFYYLFLGWIVISYGSYFFLNYSFGISFLMYILGLAFFSYLYFLFLNISFINFWLSFLVLILINLEFFLLFSYLSSSVLVLSIFLLLIFRFFAYFYKNRYFLIAPLL